MQRFRNWSLRAVASSMVGLAVVAILVSTSSASIGDREAITATIGRAQVAILDVGGSADGQMVVGNLTAALANERAALADIYYGSLFDQRVVQLSDVLRQQAAGSVLLYGGGLKSFTLTSLEVGGENATASAEVQVWSEAGMPGQNHEPATGTWLFTYQLVKVNGRWLISGEDGEPAPGSSP